MLMPSLYEKRLVSSSGSLYRLLMMMMTSFSDNSHLTVEIIPGVNCSLLTNYKFYDGSTVHLDLKRKDDKPFINYGWLNLTTSSETKVLINEKLKSSTDIAVNKSMNGTWSFQFYYNQNISEFMESENFPKFPLGDEFYSGAFCTTEVAIVNALQPSAGGAENAGKKAEESITDNKYTLLGAVAGAALLIILAQSAYIVFLRSKARKLNAHNNLSKKTEPAASFNDTARYCTNPVPRGLRVPAPVDDDDDNEVIYEAPNMLAGRLPTQPPQPPAINTMPRTPRSDHNRRIDLSSPPQTPIENRTPTFPRPKQIDREVNLAKRPRLPLPIHPQEEYEEMDPVQENTYEPPPVVNTVPPRLPMPPKKVPTGNLLDVKEDTLKLKRFNKPPVTPKHGRPRSIVTPPAPANELEQALRRRNHDHAPASTNELEQALRRRNNDAKTELEAAMRKRNNAKHTPGTPGPEPSRVPPKPRPPPAIKSKPRGTALPQPVQEEVYYNDNRGSSDEEWTYEPLKPLNNYDPNIYNV